MGRSSSMNVPSELAKKTRLNACVHDLVAVSQQDVVVSLDQGFLVGHGDATKVVGQCGYDSIFRKRDRSQFNQLLALDNLGTLVCLLDLGQQIVTVIESGDAPTAISTQAAHDAARINHCVGRLQILTTIDDGRGLSFFQSDFSVIRFAAF
jgi:hypothetical protein